MGYVMERGALVDKCSIDPAAFRASQPRSRRDPDVCTFWGTRQRIGWRCRGAMALLLYPMLRADMT